MENTFAALRKQMETEDAMREHVIKRSRDALKASKAAIYALHRDDLEEGRRLIGEASTVLQGLFTEVSPALRQQGALSSAVEEYVEAALFLHFLDKQDLLSYSEHPDVLPEEYLGAISDFTGELGRHAVLRAIAKDKERVQKVRELVDMVYGELSQFDFRNSELRRKFDAVKYNLQKIENVLYELSL